MNTLDKEEVSSMERKVAESWRTLKKVKDGYKTMSDQEIREELGDLKIDMILAEKRLSEVIK